MLFLYLIILFTRELFTQGVSATISDSSCILPPYPENGRYSLQGQGKNLVPGDEVSKPAVLHYSCSPDFILSYELSVCQGYDVWTPIPTCTKPCKLFASYTVEYTCYSSENLVMSCQSDMPHGSSVLFECKTGHTLSKTQTLDEMRCNYGVWSTPLPECEADCGLDIADGATFIINAPVAKLDTLPWHVAVYERKPEITFICGGTILTTKIVISAAHCFYDPIQKRPEPAEHFLVAANKHFQSWEHPNETDVPKSEVTEIRLHEWYTGELHHHQNDVALLVLETPFEFSNTVGAICYDFVNQRFDQFQLSPSSKIKAKFAGWGVTEEERTSEELRVLNVPFIDQGKCVEEYEKYHSERYVTADKICAGYTNGSTGCNGDSGAGLVFPYPQGGQMRWWLRGILSVGPWNKFTCRNNTYTAFTRVFALRKWIKRQINDLLAQREIYLGTFRYTVPETLTRSQLDRSFVSMVVTSLGCLLPEFPSHGKYIILGRYEDDLVPGDSVLPPTHLKYSCDAGYKATAEIFSECREDNSWSSFPACREVSENEEESRGPPSGVFSSGAGREYLSSGRGGSPSVEYPNSGYPSGGGDEYRCGGYKSGALHPCGEALHLCSGYPSGGESGFPSGRYPNGGGGGYPIGGYPSGRYPNGGEGGYPSGGGGGYPFGGYPSGRYPNGGRFGYPSGGGDGYPSDGYLSGGGSGYPSNRYPSDGGGGYPSGRYPNGERFGYPSGRYPNGGGGGYPIGGYPSGRYPNGGRFGYPSGGGDEYPSDGYPSGGESAYPSDGGGGYPSDRYPSDGGGGNPSDGYPTGGGSTYLSGGYSSGRYPSGGGDGYPNGAVDRYPNGGYPSGRYPNGGGDGYPNGAVGRYPSGGYPSGGGGRFPSDRYPTGGGGAYPSGGYSNGGGGGYRSGGGSGYPSGGYPSSGYPSGVGGGYSSGGRGGAPVASSSGGRGGAGGGYPSFGGGGNQSSQAGGAAGVGPKQSGQSGGGAGVGPKPSSQASGGARVEPKPGGLAEESHTWAPEPVSEKPIEARSGCYLPEFPKGGNYTVIAEDENNVKPGDMAADFTFLIYSCDNGYVLSEQYSICQENNQWSYTPTCTANTTISSRH